MGPYHQQKYSRPVKWNAGRCRQHENHTLANSKTYYTHYSTEFSKSSSFLEREMGPLRPIRDHYEKTTLDCFTLGG